MPFRRAFALTGALLLMSVSVLGALALIRQDRVLSAASQGFRAVDRLGQLLSVAEMLDRERAEVEEIWVANADEQPGLHARLERQRVRTDSAIYVLEAELGAGRELPAVVREEVAALRPALAQARTTLDRALAASVPSHDLAVFGPALNALAGINDPVSKAETGLLVAARQNLPELGEALAAVVDLATVYREAGLLRTQLVLASASGQLATPAGIERLAQLRGRLALRHEQLEAQVQGLPPRADILAAWQVADQRYFAGAGMISDKVDRALLAGGHDLPLPADILKNFAAGMESLLPLRDVALEAVSSDARAVLDVAQLTQIELGAAALGAAVGLALTGWLLFGRLLAALDEAVAAVAALAADDLERRIAIPKGRDEISQLLEGLLGLRGAARERQALERERDSLREALADQANIDRLTGVATLRSFEIQAEGHFANNQRHHHPLAVMVLDVDQFRQVNDIYGNASGDMVLVAIADLCQRMSRAGDVVARSGGEEFIILMPNTTLEGAVVHAERLRASIEGTRIEQPDGVVIRVTASFGVAQCLSIDSDLHDARMRAEVMLLEAKQLGRNRVRYNATRNVPNTQSSMTVV